MAHDDSNANASAEEDKLAELAAPKTVLIHEVVRRQGEDELARPAGSLFWSGIAGGVALTTSLVAQGAVSEAVPPDASWRQVALAAGYSLGFVLVVLGRMQLFTEQTIVAVLPVMSAPGWRKLGSMARLWALVFAGNLIGTCGAAAMNTYFSLMPAGVRHGMLESAAKLLRVTPLETLEHGVPAGFLVASVAWLRAGVTSGEVWIVMALTGLIALGDFTHVIAGSAEAFMLAFSGQTGFPYALGGLIAPALVGNVLGGTGLFSLLAYAQVRREI